MAKKNIQDERLIEDEKAMQSLLNAMTKMKKAEMRKNLEAVELDDFEEIDEEEMEAYEKDMDEAMFEELMSKEGFYTEEEYRDAIGKWLEHVSLSDFIAEIEKRVIGQENLKKVCYNIYHYLELIATGSEKNLPFLIAAPSGCGKSETYRAVKDYFRKNMKFLYIEFVDCSALTEAGFKGNDPSSVVGGLLDKPNSNGIGIVFLDEVDKKVVPSYTTGGTNVNAAVQHGLLTIMEGCPVRAKGTSRAIDTSNTLFVAMGAFDFLRNEKEEEKTISFGEQKEKREHYDDVTREELLEAGALNEFVGRLSSIVNYHKLTEEAVRNIINLNISEMEKEFHLSIQADKNVYEEMYELANGKFGCRTIKNILRDRVQALDMATKLAGKPHGPLLIRLNEDGDTCEDKTAELRF